MKENQSQVPPAPNVARGEVGPVPAVTPQPAAINAATNIKNKLTEKLSGLRASKPAPRIPKKILVVLGIVLVLLILLLVAARVGNLGQRIGGGAPAATSSPTPEPTATVEVPSQYADDADVAEIQGNMEELDKELNDANFREDRLRVPVLDWEVEFK
jgi:hypothetical protein